jgi:hypothetical protein
MNVNKNGISLKSTYGFLKLEAPNTINKLLDNIEYPVIVNQPISKVHFIFFVYDRYLIT